MKALGRALRDLGEPLFFPYHLPADIRRGDLVMLLAAQKVGKSTVAMDWSIRLASHGEPVLYVTTDTRVGEQGARAAAHIFNVSKDAVKADREKWGSRLTGVGWPLRFSSADISIVDFDELVDGEAEYVGGYPTLIVVDVAHDLIEGDEATNTVRTVWRKLHATAGRTHAVILALHHVKGTDAMNGTQFVGMEDSLFPAPGRIAEIVITAWRPGPDQISLHLAKNRGGEDGQTVTLATDYDRAKVVT